MAVDILIAITVALYAAEHLPQLAPHSYASDKSYHFTIVFAAQEQIRKVAITITMAATQYLLQRVWGAQQVSGKL